MRKVIAAINMTLDGNCDHTLGIADGEIHQHYTDLLRSADTILYGRITYQLMEFWPTLLAKPSGNRQMDEFAVAIDRIEKIVFSHTLKEVQWKTARLEHGDLKEEVLALRQQDRGDILVGSRSLIISLLNVGLVDEFQINVQPRIAGGEGRLSLFENIKEKIELKLITTKTFQNGSVIFCYAPIEKQR
jgi:dihydrofolate reductase